jgi:hypothetical protein
MNSGPLLKATGSPIRLKVPFEYENWLNIIAAINSEIRKIAQLPKSAEKIDSLKLYSQSAKQFTFIKDARTNACFDANEPS